MMNSLKKPEDVVSYIGSLNNSFHSLGNVEQNQPNSKVKGRGNHTIIPRTTHNRIYMSKMICLTILPIMGLWGYSLYTLSDTITTKSANDHIKQVLLESIQLAQLIHQLQSERDMTLLYLSDIGTTSKSFLLQEYDKTASVLDKLCVWPISTQNRRPEYETKLTFRTFLSQHRQELSLRSDNLGEINFYTDVIDFIMMFLQNSINDSKLAFVWKSLVAYQKISSAKEDVGLERALGTLFFTNGKFPSQELKTMYNYRINTFKARWMTAGLFSNKVHNLYTYEIARQRANITEIVSAFRYEIQHHDENKTHINVSKSRLYYDNMTLYMNILFKVQEYLALAIIDEIDTIISDSISQLALNATFLVLVIMMCPVLAIATATLTSDTQKYENKLVFKTNELNKEKVKIDSLLYQMVPKTVADKLKQNKQADAEYFKCVTILFSEVCDFHKICSEISPMEVVHLLNALYNSFDGLLDKYDVYKVETINDCYMVASGLPHRNKTRHVFEIAELAIDLLALVKSEPIYKDMFIKLRIGIHTGSCVAGVIGSVMPRYCLYGDTVNTASRMKTQSSANSIQMSQSTYELLYKSGKYVIKKRGSISVKGKGDMITHWLVGKNVPDVARLSGASHRENIPGEVSDNPDINRQLISPHGSASKTPPMSLAY